MAGFYEQRDRDGTLIGWQAKVRKKGYPTQTHVFRSKREAQEWAAIIESEMARGIWKDRSEAESTTLKDCLERYLVEVMPSKKSAKPEINRLRQWMERPIALQFMAAIRGKDVAMSIRDMEAEGKGSNTIRLHLAVLSHLYRVARTEWGMDDLVNPVELVRKPRLPQGRDRRLTGDEEERLLTACNVVNTELAAIMQLAIETGMRQGEIMGITWDNVSITKCQVFLPDTKNGTARTVPLSSKALAVLSSLPHRMDGRVWSYTQDGMRASWAKALKRAGITGLTFHDLRHEATSRLFEKGLNPMQVAAITGHKTLQMLKRYTHLRAEDLVKLLG
ncbi:site-specific integrase [Acidithiobacillus sp. MC6.1]|nr:site-specific integrase [Acidithiobacillus sp. MC6.1]